MLYAYEGKTPKIGKDVFIAPNAVIIGDVEIEDGANIWYGAVLRGDMSYIRIGKCSNVQDNSTIHTDFDKPAIIGECVTIGHNAVIHACTVQDFCLIGIGALVLNESLVGKGTIVAAGSLVKEKQVLASFKLYAGIPCVEKKQLPQSILEDMKKHALTYCSLAQKHSASVNICG